MTGSGAVVDDRGSDSGRSSSAGHHPVDDPQVQQQQHYIPPQYSNMDRRSEGSQHSHYNPQQQQQPSYTSNEPPAWNQSQQQPQYPPPAGAPPPPAQQAYPPQAGPYPQHQHYQPQQYGSQQYQSQQYQSQQYQPQQQYGTGPYNNSSAPPSRAPPGGHYPQQQHPQQSAQPQDYASPLRYSTAQVPVSPRLPYTPGLLRPELGPPVPWTSEIFGFLQDCHGCFLTVLAPCITFGQIAEIMDTGYNSCYTAAIIYFGAMLLGVPCLYSYTYRTKMRRHFNLRPDPMEDICVHFFCEFCALSQEYRELVYRGIDPALGYAMQSNVIAQAMDNPSRPSLAPPVQMNMMK